MDSKSLVLVLVEEVGEYEDYEMHVRGIYDLDHIEQAKKDASRVGGTLRPFILNVLENRDGTIVGAEPQPQKEGKEP